ncbi:XerC/D-like integrase [Halanaeroarchaeum sulfurireducens]|uniref:XerC/D-like integrase n=2 Tax=Halanaeroarchaeum sulfurireducens TaxID=1604004 RepID=A0A0F7P9V3_9EURY|nr:XerC/D-like integrase [Halanaeroarchaeum sulfurireducens]
MIYRRCRPWSHGVTPLPFGDYGRCSRWFGTGSNRDSWGSLDRRRPTMSLEPIDAETALELYLADKDNELSEASLTGHKYRLGHFVRWCNDVEGIENLNTLSGRQLHRYRLWRREDGDLNKVSEKTQMDTLRVFIRWLESIDGVEQDLSEKVLSPSITPDENSRDVMLDSDSASKVLAHLEKYEYAGIQHVSIALMWHTMMRVGGVHVLDVDDYDPAKQYIKVRHRPDTGTPIKKKETGSGWSPSRISSATSSTTGSTPSDRQ